MKNIIYDIASRFFLTRSMISRIEGRVAILYPSDRQSIINKTINQFMKIVVLVALMVYLLISFSDVKPYMIAMLLATVYCVVNTFIHRQLDKLETELLEHMLKFIEAVKFRFQFDGMLEEAIFDATGECDYIMSVHGQLIYEQLRENYMKDKCDYQEISPNQFFLTFYSMCESVMKYGDKKTKEGSQFIKNLGYLKEDIHLELIKRKSVENTFMGLGGICIVPIFCIKPIELWGISNMPELAESYSGRTGTLTTIILAAVALLIYQIIIRLKYPVTSYRQKKKWVGRMLDIGFIKGMNTWYMNRHVKRLQGVDKLLKNVGYTYNIAEFCVYRFLTSCAAAGVSMLLALSIGFDVSSVAFGVMGYVSTYYGQLIMILLRKQLMLMERESEIMRFQGIILMLMYADRITIDQILAQMERFASSFRQQLEEISDKLSYRGIAVFKEYKDKSDFLPFNRIIDGFIACDDMYIHKAFEDVESDRQYYIEKHKQDNKYYIEQRGAIGKFLSFIPICLVVIVKLIVPFVIEGMNQMAVSGMQF